MNRSGWRVKPRLARQLRRQGKVAKCPNWSPGVLVQRHTPSCLPPETGPNAAGGTNRANLDSAGPCPKIKAPLMRWRPAMAYAKSLAISVSALSQERSVLRANERKSSLRQRPCPRRRGVATRRRGESVWIEHPKKPVATYLFDQALCNASTDARPSRSGIVLKGLGGWVDMA